MLNSTITEETLNENIENKNDLFFTYLCPILGICGFVLHSLSFMVYSNSKFKEMLYKYLKMESLNVLLDLLITAIKPIYYCRTCNVSKTYFVQIYFIALIVYVPSILELSAILNRNLSTICCLMILRKNIKKIRLLLVIDYYKIINLIIWFISSLIFVYQVFEYKIVNINHPNGLDKIYKIEKSQFSNTTIKSVLELTAFIFRDGLNLTILIILNILIFICFKNDLSKKKAFLKTTNSNTKDELVSGQDIGTKQQSKEDKYKINNVSNRIKKCETKQTFMVFVTCLCCIIGRLPILIFFILRNFKDENKYLILNKIAVMFIYLTYIFNFFLYYHSNKRFKKILINIFIRFFSNFLNLKKKYA